LSQGALLGILTLFVIVGAYAVVAAQLARRLGRRALWIAWAVFALAVTALFTAGASRTPGGELDPTLATAIATLATFGIPSLIVTAVLHAMAGRPQRPSLRKHVGTALTVLVVAVPLGGIASFAADFATTIGTPPPAPWVRVMKNRRADVLLDTSRLQRTAEGTRVWIRIDEAVAGAGADTYDRVQAWEEVDCRARRAKDLHVQVSRGDAPLLRSIDVSPQPWLTFNVHPMGEPLFDGVCERLSALDLSPKPRSGT
jgi:hypothetical protein